MRRRANSIADIHDRLRAIVRYLESPERNYRVCVASFVAFPTCQAASHQSTLRHTNGTHSPRNLRSEAGRHRIIDDHSPRAH